jgi:hypothetical protein
VGEQFLCDLLARLDRLERRFPTGARCALCDQRNRFVLCRSRQDVLCYGCRVRRRGGRSRELHHLGGKPSTLTVPVAPNLHRLLTLLQDLWRCWLEPGSPEAILIDLILWRVLSPSFPCDE